MKIPFLILLLLTTVFASAKAADYVEPEQAFAFHLAVLPGQQYEIRANVLPGFAVYRDKISVQAIGLEGVRYRLPAGDMFNDPAFGPVSVLTGFVRIPLAPTLRRAGDSSTLVVKYSGCRLNEFCYPPQTVRFDLGGM